MDYLPLKFTIFGVLTLLLFSFLVILEERFPKVKGAKTYSLMTGLFLVLFQLSFAAALVA